MRVLNPRKIEIEDRVRGASSRRIEGRKFYFLECLEYFGRAFYRCQMQAVYSFKCKCGVRIMAYAKEVREGRVKSCGCHVGRAGKYNENPRNEMWKNFWSGEHK